MKFIIVAALTLCLLNVVHAQGAPRFSEVAVLKNEQRSLVVEFTMTPKNAGAQFTVELQDCLNDLAQFATETKARGGVVFASPDYVAIGDQSSVMNVRHVLLGLRCELTPRPPFSGSK
jgi:hypothetical protein